MVGTVENGERAIAVSEERFFNATLIDIRLSAVDGTELLKN